MQAWQPGRSLTDLAAINGEYLRDILHQPQSLEDTLAGLETSKPLQDLAGQLNQGKFERVVLTGMGSSFHALHPLNLELISHGLTPFRTGEQSYDDGVKAAKTDFWDDGTKSLHGRLATRRISLLRQGPHSYVILQQGRETAME